LHILRLGVGLGDARALVLEEVADRPGFGVADRGEVADRLRLARFSAAPQFRLQIRSVLRRPGSDMLEDLLRRLARVLERCIELGERRGLPDLAEGLQRLSPACLRPCGGDEDDLLMQPRRTGRIEGQPAKQGRPAAVRPVR
jgi:hypothetical protein